MNCPHCSKPLPEEVTISKLFPTYSELVRRDIALTECAHDLLIACDMDEQNEAIMHGKKMGRAWNGDFVLKKRLDAMARVRVLTDPKAPPSATAAVVQVLPLAPQPPTITTATEGPMKFINAAPQAPQGSNLGSREGPALEPAVAAPSPSDKPSEPSDLVKRIRAYHYGLADEVEQLERELADAYRLAVEPSLAIAALYAITPPEWISTSDRPPASREVVVTVCRCNDGTQLRVVGHHDERMGWILAVTEDVVVTHWAPLRSVPVDSRNANEN